MKIYIGKWAPTSSTDTWIHFYTFLIRCTSIHQQIIAPEMNIFFSSWKTLQDSPYFLYTMLEYQIYKQSLNKKSANSNGITRNKPSLCPFTEVDKTFSYIFCICHDADINSGTKVMEPTCSVLASLYQGLQMADVSIHSWTLHVPLYSIYRTMWTVLTDEKFDLNQTYDILFQFHINIHTYVESKMFFSFLLY